VPERRDPPHGDRLSRRQLNRLNRVLAVDDPTGEIGAAWAAKSSCASYSPNTNPTDPRRAVALPHRLPEANTREATRLALTIETWWPAILVNHRRPGWTADWRQ
jgi:hypothetical protein